MVIPTVDSVMKPLGEVITNAKRFIPTPRSPVPRMICSPSGDLGPFTKGALSGRDMVSVDLASAGWIYEQAINIVTITD